MGCYLREWGADIICLQEMMLAQLEQRSWTTLEWGSRAAHVAIEASGRSGGILLAWKEDMFEHLEGTACGGGPFEEPKGRNPLCGGLGVRPHPPGQARGVMGGSETTSGGISGDPDADWQRFQRYS